MYKHILYFAILMQAPLPVKLPVQYQLDDAYDEEIIQGLGMVSAMYCEHSETEDLSRHKLEDKDSLVDRIDSFITYYGAALYSNHDSIKLRTVLQENGWTLKRLILSSDKSQEINKIFNECLFGEFDKVIDFDGIPDDSTWLAYDLDTDQDRELYPKYFNSSGEYIRLSDDEFAKQMYYGIFGVVAEKLGQTWCMFLPCAQIFWRTDVLPILEEYRKMREFLRIRFPLHKSSMLDQNLRSLDLEQDLGYTLGEINALQDTIMEKLHSGYTSAGRSVICNGQANRFQYYFMFYNLLLYGSCYAEVLNKLEDLGVHLNCKKNGKLGGKDAKGVSSTETWSTNDEDYDSSFPEDFIGYFRINAKGEDVADVWLFTRFEALNEVYITQEMYRMAFSNDNDDCSDLAQFANIRCCKRDNPVINPDETYKLGYALIYPQYDGSYRNQNDKALKRDIIKSNENIEREAYNARSQVGKERYLTSEQVEMIREFDEKLLSKTESTQELGQV